MKLQQNQGHYLNDSSLDEIHQEVPINCTEERNDKKIDCNLSVYDNGKQNQKVEEIPINFDKFFDGVFNKKDFSLVFGKNANMPLSDVNQISVFKRILAVMLYNDLTKKEKKEENKKEFIKNEEKLSLEELYEKVKELKFRCVEEKNYKFIFKNILLHLKKNGNKRFKNRFGNVNNSCVKKEYLRSLMRKKLFYQSFLGELYLFIEEKKYLNQQKDKIVREIKDAKSPKRKKIKKIQIGKKGIAFYLENLLKAHHFHTDREINLFADRFLRLVFYCRTKADKSKSWKEYTKDDFRKIPR